VRGYLPVQRLGFLGTRQAIAFASEDQDRHVIRDRTDRVDGRDLVEMG
jgi:hypothetical protein